MAKIVQRRVPKQGDRPPQKYPLAPSKGDNKPIVRRRPKGGGK